MEDMTYSVRIKSRYDIEADWIAVDPVLLEGEIAIVRVKSDIPNSLPEIRIKTGDGIHKYSELPFTSAIASDVYPWAKQKSKPTYTADEIEGLSDLIQNTGGNGFVPHTHPISDITGLQEALDKKSESSNTGSSTPPPVVSVTNIIAKQGGGLTVTKNEDDEFIIGIDANTVFMLDGGDSSQFQS